MMPTMKHALCKLMLALAMAISPLALPAFAGDEDKALDVRLANYKESVVVKDREGPVTWMIFIGLAGLCLICLLKNAKRTHLD